MSDESKTGVKKEVIDIESRFATGNLDDIDFDKVELVRGKTPEDIEQKCLKLCQDYLSGNWSQQTIQMVEVRRITGGLMNQIYYCGIRQPDNSGDVPQEVAIKFYGEFNPFNEDKTRMKDLIVSLIFSENNLGPKVYGCFEGGVIQKFYKHRIFGGEKEKSPEVIRKVFRSLAKIHSLEFPIKRNGKHFLEMMQKLFDDNFETKIKALIEEYNCETFKKYDFKTEIDWIKGVIERVNSPVVFCHNDFRSANLLVTEHNEDVVVCDYDLSEYGFRGNDFVFMMREWGKKHFIDNMHSIEGLPLQSEMRPFIEVYVEECGKIHGKSFTDNPNNSVEHILKEVKTNLLMSFLLFTAFHMGPRRMQPKDDNNNAEEDPEQTKRRMDGLEKNYKNYIQIKTTLKEQNLFD